MSNRAVLIMSLAAATIIAVMLFLTTPSSVGPFGTLLFFAAVYVATFGFATVLVQIFHKILHKQKAFGRKQYFYAAIIAFAPIMLLLAQSLGSISIFTVALTIFFVLLGCFLVSKKA